MNTTKQNFRKELSEEGILSAIQIISLQCSDYVGVNFLNNFKSINTSRKEIGISACVITKLKKKESISIKSIIKILKSVGKLNSESLLFILQTLVTEFKPDLQGRLVVREKTENDLSTTECTSLGAVYKRMHQLCEQDQLFVQCNGGFSRSFISSAMNDTNINQSIERLNALFWYYSSILTQNVPEKLIEDYLNLLCKKMLDSTNVDFVVSIPI